MDVKRSVHSYSVESLDINRSGSYQFNSPPVPRWRRLLAQFVAASAINLILFDIGLALSFPTLVVPALGVPHDAQTHNGSDSQHKGINYNSTNVHGIFTIIEPTDHRVTSDPTLELSFFRHYSLTDYEITWYVSVVYICQPIGSILGGSVIGLVGRKRLMQVLNLFMLCAWLLPFFSKSSLYMYISNILFGIGIGCSESPIATYLGEVTQVSVRGVILTLAQVFLSISFLIPYLISLAVSSWRWQSLVMSSIPILTFIMCSIVPESPAWLVSKQRYEDAERSLKWLRGWTSAEHVKEELDEITAYHVDTSKSNGDSFASSSTSHKSTEELVKSRSRLEEKMLYFFGARMRRPFFIVCVLFALLYVTGMCTIRPYLVQLFQDEDFNITMDPDKCALWVTFAGAVGNIVSLLLVKYTGKRFIVLSALSGSAVCTMSIAFIKMDVLSSSYSFVMFVGVSFFSGYGIVPLPWILQSELYPFRGRGVASGVGAAFSYLVGFVSTKTYLELVHLITLQGVFIVFTCFSIYGLIYLWIRLPETEGKSFQQIDLHFNKHLIKDQNKEPEET